MFISKNRKTIYSIFIVLMLSILITPFICYAVDPENMDPEVYKYIEVRSNIKDAIRSCLWTVLTFLAKIIDYINSAIDEVLSINLYDMVKDYLPQSTVLDIAWVIFSLSLVIAGIILIINGDKIKIQDFFRNILISVCFLVAFPSLISVLLNFQNISKSTADMITSGEETEIVHGLGEDLLADNIIYLPDCLVDGKIHYFSNSDAYSNTSVYSININGAMSQDMCDFKFESSEVTTNQKIYSELTAANKMALLGLNNDYQWWLNYLNEDPSGHITITWLEATGGAEHPYEHTATYCVRNHNDSKDGSYHCPMNESSCGIYEQYLIEKIAENPYVEDAGLSASVKSSRTINNALTIIEDVLKDMNIRHNQNMVETGTDQTFRANISPLRTQEEYDDLAWYQQLSIDLLEGYSEERVYGYDFSFLFTVISLIISGACLVFALFKLCRMLYEIVFMRIAVPLFIAADANGSGKGKKALLQLINTFIILLVILVLLRIYISSISWIHNNIDNFVAEWALIFTGMSFVIDGPDFIVKMTGLDAGVKSGAATLMSLKSGIDIAKNAASAPSKMIHSANSMAEKAGGKTAGFKDSMAQKGLANKAKALVGNSGMGQAFRRGTNNQLNNNASYKANKDMLNSTDTPAFVKGEKGDKGDNGPAGANGKDAQESLQTPNNSQTAASPDMKNHTPNVTNTAMANSQNKKSTAEDPVVNNHPEHNTVTAAPTSQRSQTADSPKGKSLNDQPAEATSSNTSYNSIAYDSVGHSNEAKEAEKHDTSETTDSSNRGRAFENISAPVPQKSDTIETYNTFANAEFNNEQRKSTFADKLKNEEGKS